MAGGAGRRMLLALVALVGAGFLTAPTAIAATAAPTCPAVALFAVAGTNETSEAADPARSVGLLAGLTDPLARRWGDDLSVRYVPYPASLDRPVLYPFSEGRGAERLARDAGDLAVRCPDTTITLVGFSQGADVVSNLDVTVFRDGWASGAHRSYPSVEIDGVPLFTVLERAMDAVVVRATTGPVS